MGNDDLTAQIEADNTAHDVDGNGRHLERAVPLARLAFESEDDYERLWAIDQAVKALTVALYQSVDAARIEGLSWESIGDALSVSKQAAHKRFSAQAE